VPRAKLKATNSRHVLRDCLVTHCQRTNYQAAIWRRYLHQDPQVPSPVGRGRKDERESTYQLVVDRMDGKPAPEAILNLWSCNCARKCSSLKCVNVANGPRCTDMCRHPNCENQPSTEEEWSQLRRTIWTVMRNIRPLSSFHVNQKCKCFTALQWWILNLVTIYRLTDVQGFFSAKNILFNILCDHVIDHVTFQSCTLA